MPAPYVHVTVAMLPGILLRIMLVTEYSDGFAKSDQGDMWLAHLLVYTVRSRERERERGEHKESFHCRQPSFRNPQWSSLRAFLGVPILCKKACFKENYEILP